MVIIGVGRGNNQEATLYKQEAMKIKLNRVWDVHRKALNGYCGPFVGYEYFPSTYRPSRKKRKQRRKHTT